MKQEDMSSHMLKQELVRMHIEKPALWRRLDMLMKATNNQLWSRGK